MFAAGGWLATLLSPANRAATGVNMHGTFSFVLVNIGFAVPAKWKMLASQPNGKVPVT